MTLILFAAGCMVVQDILAVLLTDAEARNRGWLAGILDSAVWLFAIATTTIAVTALQGHSLAGKVELVVFVTVANLIGMRLGVWIGKRNIKNGN